MNATLRAVAAMYLTIAALVIGFWGTVIYIAWHFINKLW